MQPPLELALHQTIPNPGDTLVVHDTLACLDRACPGEGFDTPRYLDDDTHSGVFDAWEVAVADVIERWNRLADKANLEPRLVPTLVKAGDIVRDHAPSRLTQEEIDRAVDTLSALYLTRIVRTL